VVSEGKIGFRMVAFRDIMLTVDEGTFY